MIDPDKWWSRLKVTDKEVIATKVAGERIVYPFCTSVWNTLDENKKMWIQNHCEKKHGITMPMWQEGNMFSE